MGMRLLFSDAVVGMAEILGEAKSITQRGQPRGARDCRRPSDRSRVSPGNGTEGALGAPSLL